MVLIYTALLCEAQSFIEKLKLKKINSTPKIYKNNNYIIVIGGVGKENTIKSLNYTFNNFKIKKAINIGIGGIVNKNIQIGTLCSSLHKHNQILYKNIITVTTPQQLDTTTKIDTIYDMEAKYFLEIVSQYLPKIDIEIFKIVSDHLDNFQLSKDDIKKLISAQLPTINRYLN